MHYYIDGYNLLFHLMLSSENLQNQRDAFILDLNKKISLIKLNVSIVFDAAHRMGSGKRTHYEALEILYTAEGETADDYILKEIENATYPHQETIVTSDKTLARLLRNCSAHVESSEEFMLRINRAYKNKIKEKKQIKLSLPLSPPSQDQIKIPAKNVSLDAYSEYYENVFEIGWQAFLDQEQKDKDLEISSTPPKRISRTQRKKIDPFQHTNVAESQEPTDEVERWLKLFEKRLIDPNFNSS